MGSASPQAGNYAKCETEQQAVMTNRGLYIVAPNKQARGTSEHLTTCLQAIKGNVQINVRKVVGTDVLPERVIIEAPPDAIDKLRQQFGNQLIIEADSPLQLGS